MRKYIFNHIREYCQSLYEEDRLKERAVSSEKIYFETFSSQEDSNKKYRKGEPYYILKYAWKYCFDYFAAASVVYMDELRSRGRFREEWDVASIGCGKGFDYWALDMARFVLSDSREEKYKDCQSLRESRIHYRGYDLRPVERFREEDEYGDCYEYSEEGIEAWYESKEINDIIFFGRSVGEVFGAKREDLREQPAVKANIDRFASALTDKICEGEKEVSVYLVMVYIQAPDQKIDGGLIETQCGSYLISRLKQDCKIKAEMVRLPLDRVGYLEEKTLDSENYSGVTKYLGIVETKNNMLLLDERMKEFLEIWQFNLLEKGYHSKSMIIKTLKEVSGNPNEHMLTSDKYSAYHIIKISKCS